MGIRTWSELADETWQTLGHSERSATAGLDCLTSDVLAFVGDEERDQLRDVFRLLDATEFDVPLDSQGLGVSDRNALLRVR